METADLKKLVERLAPGSLLQCVNFGRSTQACAWIETHSLVKLAEELKRDPTVRLNIVENLSAMQMDEVIVLTYFLRSSSTSVTARIRGSVAIENVDEVVNFPSMRKVWPSAEVFEREISELFGIDFSGLPSRDTRILPEDWVGFPLRKTFTLSESIHTPDAGGME